MPSAPFGFSPPIFEGSISNYTPPLRDQAAYWLARNWFGDDREGVEKAKRLTNIAEYTPFGFATMADDTTRDVGRGDYVGAGLNLAMAAIPGPNPKGIRAYHGSPYDFNAERRVRMPDGYEQYIVGQPDVLPDIPPGATVLQDYPLGRFREDKIGTGEGAAAYGHGAAYVAEEERVARDYRDQLQWKGANFNDVQVIAQNALDRFRGDRAAAADSLQSAVDSTTRFYRGKVPAHQAKADKDVEDAIALLRSDAEITGKPPKPGKMYEVQINADPDQFLDWDKPLSEQPESVRTYFGGDPEFNAVVSKNPGNPFYNMPLRSPPTGAELWRKIVGTDDPVKRRQSAQGAAKKLAEMGIPGIKYLDQGSRAKGDGSRNYVVFDDSLINILRKYGIVLPFAGAALGNMPFGLAPSQEQQ